MLSHDFPNTLLKYHLVCDQSLINGTVHGQDKKMEGGHILLIGCLRVYMTLKDSDCLNDLLSQRSMSNILKIMYGS